MRNNNILDYDVDLAELASLTKNFSGAEIAGKYLLVLTVRFGQECHILFF